MKWRFSHERNRNNKFRHARLRQRRVVAAYHGKRGHTCGRAAEGERNMEGANEMKIFTNEFEEKLVSIIGTAIVLGIALIIIGLVGWIETGM